MPLAMSGRKRKNLLTIPVDEGKKKRGKTRGIENERKESPDPLHSRFSMRKEKRPEKGKKAGAGIKVTETNSRAMNFGGIEKKRGGSADR